VEKRRLGRLEHLSSVLIYGGAALANVEPERADESVAFALESGINHFDTSDDYGGSESHLGRWMPRIRDDIFLATKTTVPSRSQAAETTRRSLERLQVDRVDLIQLHAICSIEELDEVTGPGGALEALIAARDEGLTGGIGITGHGVNVAATHLEALRRFPFDTVLTPYNYRLWQDPAFRPDFEALLEHVRAEDVGLMLIKHVARNLWPDSADRRPGMTWYQPLDEVEWIDAAVAFALRLEEATGLATPGDVDLLPRIVEAERRAASITNDVIDAALERVPAYESPFVRTPGHWAPSWLPEHGT
jgi:aryl-alcohol dehydrogenase-like predicted oxidoreductase